MDQLDRLEIGSRVFCMAAILGLIALTRAPENLLSLIIMMMVGTTAIYVTLATPLPPLVVMSAEALIAGMVIGLGLPESQVLLPYLVVLALLAGLSQGLLGLAVVTIAQLVAIVVLPMAFGAIDGMQQRVEVLAPWLLTALGIGLLGAWLKRGGRGPRVIALDPSYESARRLLSQLRTVARQLSAGLDSFGMSSQLLTVVHEHLEDEQSAVFVRTDGGVFSPLSYRGVGAREALLPDDATIKECWTRMEPTHLITAAGLADRRRWTVLPLRVGARMIGFVISASGATPAPATLKALMREVDEHSMRIDTALAFDEVRTIATTDERRRLAREIHDGIAQEVASLGYVVDEMAARSMNPDHVRELRSLRGELTRVVSELRLSIFDLRSEILPQAGLGAALTDYVRQVGSRSNMRVHISLDEAATRLTASVEAELFRIAQEAITNARKHSRASNLWVDCQVRPPNARIEISDDGCGILKRREDSFGLRIMQERASRIDASLSVASNKKPGAASGTVVRVTLNAATHELVREPSHP
ncbi:MAG TPA: ATP-binding protein [Nocardioidaceae bacterium]|nr:ATP-binding protein [Nocardioidaceae bacterium]